MISGVSDRNSFLFQEILYQPSKAKQLTLIALSVLIGLGMVLSSCLGAPWLFSVGFFTAALIPLFFVWKIRNPERIE